MGMPMTREITNAVVIKTNVLGKRLNNRSETGWLGANFQEKPKSIRRMPSVSPWK
jgi:hypothetical protein